MNPTREERERYAAEQAHQLAVDLDGLPRGAATAALEDGGRYYRLGGYVAEGFLSMAEAEAAAQGIRDRDRRRRFLSFVRDGQRSPTVPYIPDGEAPSGSTKRTRKRAAPPLPPPPDRPPYPELEALLWGVTHLAQRTGEALADWLKSRGLVPELLDERSLGMHLTTRPEWPWARCGRRDWYSAGNRLLVPLWDARGRLASVRARFVGKGKAVAPTGFAVRGLVMADATARAMLEDGLRGPARAVVITEGEPDYLTWASAVKHADPHLVAPSDAAVLGIFSGSWTEELAARIPSGCTVHIRTDDDDTGNKYAAAVHKTLAGRCTVYRAEARDGLDDNDLLQLGRLPSLPGVELQ